MNGDGNPDLLLGCLNAQGSVLFYENAGDGSSFTEHDIGSFFLAAHGGGSTQSVKLSDMNGDGALDILVAGSALMWLENNGAAAAPTFNVAHVVSEDNNQWDVYAADLDGDGNIDIVNTIHATRHEVHLSTPPAPPAVPYLDCLNSATLTYVTDLGVSKATCEASLSTSEASLSTFEASLSTCEASLSTSEASLSTFEASLSTCEASLSTSEASLSTCEASLSTCEAAAATSASGGSGTCFSSDSTVTVLSNDGRSTETVRVSNLQANHHRVLSVTAQHKKTFATVAGLRRSPGKEAYINVKIKSPSSGGSTNNATTSNTEVVRFTEHHMSPLCGNNRMIPAFQLKTGHCLHTAKGMGIVESATREAATATDETFTIVLEGDLDLVAVGGVFTHAKPEHGTSSSPASLDWLASSHRRRKKIE